MSKFLSKVVILHIIALYISLSSSLVVNNIKSPLLKIKRQPFAPISIYKNSRNVYNPLSPIRYGSYEDSGRGPSLKLIISGIILTFGIFGFGFLTPITNMMKQFSAEQQGKVSNVELKKSASEPNRGALTSLTKREINEKLAQVPIFFAIGNDGAIYTSDGVGLFFINKNDADEYAKKNNLKVSATSLDNVYYTLIVKKTKIASYINDVAKNADFSATYKLVPSKDELAFTTAEWKESHPDDIPLFRIPKLAFSKEEGLELPLFTRQEDCLSAYSRLQESQKKDSEVSDATPTVQVLSLIDLVNRFSVGGFEGRAFEIYPDMDAIEQARALMGSPAAN